MVKGEMMKATGMLKARVVFFCSVCGCSKRKNIYQNIFENSHEEIEKAKEIIMRKAAKKYTCKVCKSILQDIKDEK